MKVLIILSLLLAVYAQDETPFFCSLEFEYGRCQDSIPVWSFSQKDNGCTVNLWSGCGGNSNRFSTEEECVDICINPLGLDFGMIS